MAEDIKRLKKCTSGRPLLDAVIMTFVDDPFHYEMSFDAFKHVWPNQQIKPDYQPEDRPERLRRVERLKTEPDKNTAETSISFETGADLPRVQFHDGPKRERRE
jgi:hypothetical protein